MKTPSNINSFSKLKINDERNRSIKIFLLIAFFVFICFSFKTIKAGTSENVSGWIWSDNIGWISLNNITDGSAVDYGVNIDPSTGIFSGYAWSDSVGWISFNRSDTGVPPEPPYNGGETFIACLDLSGGGQACDGVGPNKVSGWARIVNTGPGWDGWIKLRDDAVYTDGVLYDKQDGQLEGWAWSDDIGWISFNCDSDPSCSGSTYGAFANLNTPPVAAFHCDSSGCNCHPSGCGIPANLCSGYTKCTFALVNDSTDSDGQDDIDSSTWTITGAISERLECNPIDPICDWPLQPYHVAGEYTAVLKVEDQSGAEDTSAPQNFTILQEAIADFKCSLKESGPWQDCNNFKISGGEVVYFLDDSSVSDGGGLIIRRDWEFKGGEPGLTFGNKTMASTTFIYLGDPDFGKVILTIEDQALIEARINIKEYDLNVTAPPPEWKEVSPF